MAVSLDGAFRGSQLLCDLLVDVSVHDTFEDLPLAPRQARQRYAQRIELASHTACGLVMRHRLLDGAQQLFRRDRLGQEILRTRLDGPDAGTNIGVTREEDDGQSGAELAQTVLQFGAAQIRNTNIEENASRLALIGQSI